MPLQGPATPTVEDEVFKGHTSYIAIGKPAGHLDFLERTPLPLSDSLPFLGLEMEVCAAAERHRDKER